MTSMAPPQCWDCKHLTEDNQRGFRCKAYPKGVPQAIIMGDHNHTKPYPGDGGILYEAKK